MALCVQCFCIRPQKYHRCVESKRRIGKKDLRDGKLDNLMTGVGSRSTRFLLAAKSERTLIRV